MFDEIYWRGIFATGALLGVACGVLLTGRFRSKMMVLILLVATGMLILSGYFLLKNHVHI